MSGIYCIFAKWPTPGRVKTRLARTIGAQAAAALARAFLEDTLENLANDGKEVVLALDDSTSVLSLPFPVRVWPQGGGDLGERLKRVLSRALVRHPWAIAYGTDSPNLPLSRRRAAVEALTNHGGPEAVIGPCRDGGFYLLGVRKLPAGSLEGIRWSTTSTCGDTIAALQERGLRVSELELWYDVDEAADLATLASDLALDVRVAPRTVALMMTEPKLAGLKRAFASSERTTGGGGGAKK
jgi:hypothetical protein